MKPIYDAWLIQIEITNACINKCAHCTRSVRHFRTPYFADLETIENALKSLRGWKRGVGCMGGEPTLHPEFIAVCALYRKYFPKEQCGIFTSGGSNFGKYHDLIRSTFGIIHYHNHKTVSYHQPVMVSSEEVVGDEALRNQLIDRCWLQRKWSPAISKKGAFFCEVAAMFDLLFDGPGGYPVEPGWWKRGVREFAEQRQRYCRLCSIPIPLESYADTISYDVVSKENARRLAEAGSPLAAHNGLQVLSDNITIDKIRQIRHQRKYRDPSRYARRDAANYYCDSPLRAKLWAKNIRHEFLHLVKTGDVRDFYEALRPINSPGAVLREVFAQFFVPGRKRA